MLNKKQKDDLKKLSDVLDKERKEKRKKAYDHAKKHNLKIREKTKDGRDAELIEIDDDGTPLFYITENKEGGELIKTNRVYSNGGAGYDLSGGGEILGIWDGGGVRSTHQELNGRIIQKDQPNQLLNHATHVAGTMIANGTILNAKGMSYQAKLHAYDWNNDNSEMTSEAMGGLKVSQHSYGRITGWAEGDFLNQGQIQWYWFGNTTISQTVDFKWGFYNNNTKNWDIISYNAPEYLIVKSAGNDRNYGPPPGTPHWFIVGSTWYYGNPTREIDGGSDGFNCISHEGLAKNIMTVGAVHNNKSMAGFSAWGPTNDGRVKPDIVAKGVGVFSSYAGANNQYATLNGTSMSGPMVSGSIGIILEHQKNLHPNQNLLSSTIKGLILHTADDTISGSMGPNYERGWGLMNTEKVIKLMTENVVNQNRNIREEVLQNHATDIYNITTKSISESEPLIVTLTWTDPSGTPTSLQLNPPDLMLVNDLDVCIVDGNENIYEPYILNPEIPTQGASNGDNYRDNVEKIVINNPTPNSNYKVIVTHKGNLVNENNNISTQTYSLIISGIN